VRRHLERLEELELVTARGGRSGVAIRYELLTDAAQAADIYHVGLIDVAKLRRKQVAHVAQPAEK
jgi:DNA-binding transcriptional ArsR family regulator